jgi:uncharacterized protein (DUF2141 family)
MTLLLLLPAALAGELVLAVTGEAAPAERVRCRAYAQSSAEAFPGGETPHQAQATAGEAGPVVRFSGLAAGTYAVACMLDEDDDLALDTNLLGIPVEPWGVSCDARPALRAPRFDEAAVMVPDSGAYTGGVTLAR